MSSSIQNNYPLIYAYLSQQIEKDVMESRDIPRVYKMLFNVTDKDIRSDFKNDSGPDISFSTCPHTDRDSDPHAAGAFDKSTGINGTIEISKNIMDFTEKTLRDGTPKQKLVALTILYMQVIHEESHRLEKFGEKEMGNNGCHTEGGNDAEYYIWSNLIFGMPKQHSPTNITKSDIILGILPRNDKNKEGVVEKIVENCSKEGDCKSNLPTVIDKKK